MDKPKRLKYLDLHDMYCADEMDEFLETFIEDCEQNYDGSIDVFTYIKDRLEIGINT